MHKKERKWRGAYVYIFPNFDSYTNFNISDSIILSRYETRCGIVSRPDFYSWSITPARKTYISRRDAAGKRIGAIVAVALSSRPNILSLSFSLTRLASSIGISKSRAAQVDSPDLEHPLPPPPGWRAFNRIEDSSLLSRAPSKQRADAMHERCVIWWASHIHLCWQLYTRACIRALARSLVLPRRPLSLSLLVHKLAAVTPTPSSLLTLPVDSCCPALSATLTRSVSVAVVANTHTYVRAVRIYMCTGCFGKDGRQFLATCKIHENNPTHFYQILFYNASRPKYLSFKFEKCFS